MLGELPVSGVGTPADRDCVKSVDALRANCAESNASLLGNLREDPYARDLLAATRKDAKLGRVSAPVPVSSRSAVMRSVLMHPRFSVVRSKPDGTVKVLFVFLDCPCTLPWGLCSVAPCRSSLVEYARWRCKS
jgi:hypothetical protein